MSSTRTLSVRRVQTSSGVHLVIEDASLESGEAVDDSLTRVQGLTYDDALARLKGRCFVLVDNVTDPQLSTALHALGQPEIETVRLPKAPLRDMLTGPMTKRLLPWIAVGCVLTLAGIRSMCTQPHCGRGTTPAVSVTAPAQTSAPSAPSSPEPVTTAPVEPAPIVVLSDVRNRCEPLEWPLCAERGKLCSPMPDGTKRRCRQRTRQHGDTELVCVPEVPNETIKRWRRARLRTIVEAICEPRKGCRPNELTDYLTILADRETSRRPWKRHRRDVDIEAAARAWRDHAARYEDSPARDEPWRWATGLGYYGQNPALWLWRWDTSAEPETLCGEVEATLVHLRAARQRWKHVYGIIACGDDDLFAGTSPEGIQAAELESTGWGAPSWYDISLVNSGSEACPAQPGDGQRWRQRLSFERRAERFGLDPYAPITLNMLGTPIVEGKQDEFATKLYEQLSDTKDN